jgi:hypothetical protein
MNVGELFVNLGIKGSEKTLGALSETAKKMGELGSTALTTKVAIVGAMYALEHFMKQSAEMGMGLSNFNALTGLSTKQLQQWQYAARQAGIGNEEFTGSLKAVQSSMANMLLGKGAPEGFAIVANKVGLDPKKLRDTFYVMEQLQKFSKSVPPDIANTVMKSFGLSEGTIAAMRKQVFTPDMFKKAPVISEGDINQLSKVEVAWRNINQKIEMAMGHFTAKHGLQLTKDIGELIPKVLKLADSFMNLADKLKIFTVIGKIFEGWGLLFSEIGGVVEKIGGIAGNLLSGNEKKQKGAVEDIQQAIGPGFEGLVKDVTGWLGSKVGIDPSGLFKAIETFRPQKAAAGAKTHEQNFNITNNFHGDMNDPRAIADDLMDSHKQALRQSPAMLQGN